MTGNTKNMTEGEGKDIILEYAVENLGRSITSGEIQKKLFKDNSIEEVDFLFEKMTNTIDEVADITIGKFSNVIKANEITKIFLKQGGFSATEKKDNELKEKEAEKERIDFENSFIDLRLKRWQLKTFWWFFGFAFIGFGFSVYNFINNLSSSKNVERLEQRIDKMELELKKLQTLPLFQKNPDTLNVSKEYLNKTENKFENPNKK